MNSDMHDKIGDYKQIRADMSRVREEGIRQEDVASFVKAIDQLINDDQLNESMALCNRMIDKYPNESDGYYYRGVVNAKRNLFHDAIIDLETSIVKGTSSSDSNGNDDTDNKTRELVLFLKSRITQSESKQDNSNNNNNNDEDDDDNDDNNDNNDNNNDNNDDNDTSSTSYKKHKRKRKRKKEEKKAKKDHKKHKKTKKHKSSGSRDRT